MSLTLKQKMDAQAAWDRGDISDDQLDVLKRMYADLHDTLIALDENGLMAGALRLRMSSIETLIRNRKRREQ